MTVFAVDHPASHSLLTFLALRYLRPPATVGVKRAFLPTLVAEGIRLGRLDVYLHYDRSDQSRDLGHRFAVRDLISAAARAASLDVVCLVPQPPSMVATAPSTPSDMNSRRETGRVTAVASLAMVITSASTTDHFVSIESVWALIM